MQAPRTWPRRPGAAAAGAAHPPPLRRGFESRSAPLAYRLWITSREIVQLRSELAAVQVAGSPAVSANSGVAAVGGRGIGGAEAAALSLDGGEERQPVLFYSVRAAGGDKVLPLAGPRLEDDAVAVQWDPQGRLVGQVNLVEAGRVHGWACVKGQLGADLQVVAYVDGVEVGRAQAVLPTPSPGVNRVCQLDGLLAEQAAAGGAQPHLGGAAGGGVGFVVPLPPLAQGLHAVSSTGRGVGCRGAGRAAPHACVAPPPRSPLPPVPSPPSAPAAACVCGGARRRVQAGAEPEPGAVP